MKLIKYIISLIRNLFKNNNNIVCGDGEESKKENGCIMKILIDNGHGYNTAGKRSPYSGYKTKPELPFMEWEWNREIAMHVVKDLIKLGYDAELLVPEDEDILLQDRAERVNNICDELGKDNVILVSIHANAMGDGKSWNDAKGWEAYTTVGTTKSDTIATFFYDEAERQFPNRTIRRDLKDGDPDKEAGFYIIKKTFCPAVLTENFFYTNVDDTKFILSSEGKKKVIDLHVNAIINYLNSIK